LGPILFNIFMRPIYDLIDLTSYADDNYQISFDKDLMATLGKCKMKSEFLVDWLSNSGLKVNESKTEICIFYKQELQKQKVIIKNYEIESKKELKVLGLTFDSKLTWSAQVNQSISKSRQSLHAIRLLSKYFNRDKLIRLSTAFFYQRLYYGSQIWLPVLSSKNLYKLYQASSGCLRIICKDYMKIFSFKELHILCNRSLPIQWSNYTTINMVYSILLTETPVFLFQKIKSKLILHDRTNKIYSRQSNAHKIGKNCISNRIMYLMQRFSINDYRSPKIKFKLKSKNDLLNPTLI